MGVNMEQNHRVNRVRDAQQAELQQAAAMERIAVALEALVARFANPPKAPEPAPLLIKGDNDGKE